MVFELISLFWMSYVSKHRRRSNNFLARINRQLKHLEHIHPDQPVYLKEFGQGVAVQDMVDK